MTGPRDGRRSGDARSTPASGSAPAVERRLLADLLELLAHDLGNRLGATQTALLMIAESEAAAGSEDLLDLALERVRGGLEIAAGVGGLLSEGSLVAPVSTVVRSALRHVATERRNASSGIETGIVGTLPDHAVEAVPLHAVLLASFEAFREAFGSGGGEVTVEAVGHDSGPWALRLTGPGGGTADPDPALRALVEAVGGDHADVQVRLAGGAVELVYALAEGASDVS